MSDRDQQGGAGFPAHPTADECVRAGMYWFARSDFTAAQAWWERAVELDPTHVRARECLRLLEKTSRTGFKSDATESFIGSQDLGRPNLDNPWAGPSGSTSGAPGIIGPSSPTPAVGSPMFRPSTGAFGGPASEHPGASAIPTPVSTPDPSTPSFAGPLSAEPIPSAGEEPLFSTDDLDIHIPLSIPDQPVPAHLQRNTPGPTDSLPSRPAHGMPTPPIPTPSSPPVAPSAALDDFPPEPATVPGLPIAPPITTPTSMPRPPSSVPGRSISSSGRPIIPDQAVTPDPDAPYATFAAGPHSILSPDPFDFMEQGTHSLPSVQGDEMPTSSPNLDSNPTPWDDGPSRTSVVTVADEDGFDVVAEPTPLPEIDRERFFSRGDPESADEIVSFLRATGDLPDDMSENPTQSGPAITETPLYRTAPKVDLPLEADLIFEDPEEPSGEFLDPLEPLQAEEPTMAGRVESVQHVDAIIQARDRFGLHDFDGVLEILEAIPPDALTDDARNLAAEARRNLLRMYESKIGDFDSIPKVLISAEEVIWLNLNHRAGFILSQIDGSVTFEDLVALSGMPRLDTLRILSDLIGKKVIGPS